MRRASFFVFLAAASSTACLPDGQATAFAEPMVFKSERAQKTLVELYTSDLSADCNGALAWMSALHAKQPEALWKDFVPVVMHVSYWDVPGGRDPFAKKIFDDFLMRYKKRWGVSRLYAPTVVVNGIEWGGWSHDRDVPKALPNEVGRLSADGTKRQDHFLVEFIPSKKIDAAGLTVHAALLGFGLESRPQEGDNRGRTLSHDFVALTYMKQSFRLSYGVLTSDFELSKRKAPRAQKYAAVFWVTPGDEIRPIQAVGGYLS